MWDELTFAASAALAQILTNLDNLAVLLALLVTLSTAQVLTGYAVSQIIMLAMAMGLAVGADQLLPTWIVGYLGFIPVFLGVRGLWQHWRTNGTDEQSGLSRTSGFLGVTLLFLAMSMDSFLVMAPLLTDSQPGYRLWALSGALLAVAMLCFTAILLSNTAMKSGPWTSQFERLGPIVMILAGAYVLFNSGTDVV